jgi:hypothetical protein
MLPGDREAGAERIDDPALVIDERTILFMRGTGSSGFSGSAEVVNMQPPAALIKRASLSCRASATGGDRERRARPQSSTRPQKRRLAAVLRS